MRRRAFVFGVGALLASGRVPGQPAARIRRIAILEQGAQAARSEQWRVFEERLRERGYVEGRNLAIARRWADGVDARLPSLARELLAGEPEVIAVVTTPATQALMRLTSTVPIVIAGSADPVASGLVASLARPGGNVTGVSYQLSEVAKKRVELMREIKPETRQIAMLGPATNGGVQAVFKAAQLAARAQGIDYRLLDAADAAGIERAFAKLASEPADALLVAQVMLPYRRQIIELAARARLVATYVDQEFLDEGGLLVFGPSRNAAYVHAADYVHRILEGAKPADMPVIQPTEFWLGVNLRTARALGLKIPQSVLIRADRVIE